MRKGVRIIKALHMVAYILLFVGGLNWGLVGLLNLNLVERLLGSTGLVNVVYDLVGLATVYVILIHKGDCKICGK